MTVFLRSECGYTTPIDINVDTTMKDIYDEIGGEPIFSYMGEEIKDLSQSLADLGICPESFIEYKQLEPLAFVSNQGKIIIIDTQEKEVRYMTCDSIYISDLTKIGYKKYKASIATFEISDDNSECFESIDGMISSKYYRLYRITPRDALQKTKEKYPHLFY